MNINAMTRGKMEGKAKVKGFYEFRRSPVPLYVVEILVEQCTISDIVNWERQSGSGDRSYIKYIMDPIDLKILGNVFEISNNSTCLNGDVHLAYVVESSQKHSIETPWGQLKLPRPSPLPSKLNGVCAAECRTTPLSGATNCWALTDFSQQSLLPDPKEGYTVQPGPLISCFPTIGNTIPPGTVFDVRYYAFAKFHLGYDGYNYAIHFGPHTQHETDGFLSRIDSINSGRCLDRQEFPGEGADFLIETRGVFIMRGKEDVKFCWFNPVFTLKPKLNGNMTPWIINHATLIVNMFLP